MNSLRKILLVEDDERDIEITLRAFRKHQFANQIDVARDGEEALNYLACQGPFKDRPPELPLLILLDIKMPKVDGLEFLKLVRSDPNFKFIPVVMLTSSKEQKDLVSSYGNGANAYVVKPVNYQDFVEAVKHIGLFWALLNVLPDQQRKQSGNA